jgi:hypothetical protein
MITKFELQRLIIVRLNFMSITEERPLPEVEGTIIRQPHNILEWVLPDQRYSFGGNSKTWEEARAELIDGIWNYLNQQPVTKRKMRPCLHCGRNFVSPTRRSTRYCNVDCRNAYYHVRASERRREKVQAALVE